MAEITWVSTFVDVPEARFALGARFWGAVTGWSLSERRGERGEFATLLPPSGTPILRLQAVGSGGGLHLDLHTPDIDGLARRARALGADEQHREDRLVVLRSPGGLAFCVGSPVQERVPPPATSWPGGRSLPDQVCLDIPASRYDEEAGFWAAVTRWERWGSDSGEFEHLRDPAVPARFLLQRLGEDDTGVVTRAHLDLACDDKDAEAARHVQLGAEIVGANGARHWTVLRDPAGMVYCCTARIPGH